MNKRDSPTLFPLPPKTPPKNGERACHICGSTKRSLKRPYPCVKCNARWTRQSSQTKHLRQKQIGKPCAICSQPMHPPNYDEDSNLQFRGWLCSLCNVGLGRFKNNPTLLAKAVIYLLNPAPLECKNLPERVSQKPGCELGATGLRGCHPAQRE